jgi:glycosyltransferase involved in cell wall biosynthesis
MKNGTPSSFRIKLLDFSPYYSPHIGGMEKYTEELHEQLSLQDCTITVFTPHIPPSAPQEESRSHIRIIRYPAFEIIFNYPLPCLWKKSFWQQWRKINDDEFDVVISTIRFFVQPLMALFFAHKHALPLLHIEHCSDSVKNRFLISLISRLVDRTFGRFSLSQADRIITVSQAASHFVSQVFKKDSLVLYRGLPFAEIDSLPPESDLKRELDNKIIISYIGRLIYGKGVIHLLEALAALERKDVILLIGGDGPERKNLENSVKENGLSSQVRFLGTIPFSEVIGILKITDIFVNPSYTEGLPTSILEAGSCGRAIIATDVGGTREIITSEESGIIIPAENTQAIVHALEKLLDNPHLRANLGNQLRQDIKAKFHWDESIACLLQELRLLQKKS